MNWRPYAERFRWDAVHRLRLHFDMSGDREGYIDLSWGDGSYSDPVWMIGAELEGLPKWVGDLHGAWWSWRHPGCPDPDCSLLKGHRGTHVEFRDGKTWREW